jgi:hypothetical protein
MHYGMCVRCAHRTPVPSIVRAPPATLPPCANTLPVIGTSSTVGPGIPRLVSNN